MFGFDESLQVVEACRPEGAVLADPGVDCSQGFGIELVDPMTSFAVFADQVRAAQQAEVFGNGGARNRESGGDLSSGLAAPAEQVEDGAARGIGQGLERGFGHLR
jgi:hypothetical protein